MADKTKTLAKQEYDGSTPLKRVMQEMFVNNIIAGLPQYKAYEAAGYKSSTITSANVKASQCLRSPNVKARLNYKRADIEAKTDIKLVSLQYQLIEIAQECKKKGKYHVAKSCIDSLLKTIGGFQADVMPDKNLLGKALDAGRAESLHKAIIETYRHKYLAIEAKPIISDNNTNPHLEPNNDDESHEVEPE